MEWLGKLSYDENSPTGLVWSDDVYNSLGHKTPNGYKGQIAGEVEGLTAARVGVNYVYYLCHLIVWEIHNGKVPEGMFLDHIDRDESNNRIENLRLVTRLLNNRNKGKYKTNSSGHTGVKLVSGKWIAQWHVVANKRKTRAFSVSKYGNDAAFELACNFRKRMISEANALGAGYTPSHGMTDFYQ